jgi:hypothetical protein
MVRARIETKVSDDVAVVAERQRDLEKGVVAENTTSIPRASSVSASTLA